MVPELTHFIDGTRMPGQSGELEDVFDPNTGAVQARVPFADAAQTRAAISGAAAAQPERAAWNLQRRPRVLLRLLQLVDAEMKSLARLLSSEHGKTLADSRGDIRRDLEVVEFAAGVPHLFKGEYTEGAGTGIDVHSSRQPLGVVDGIAPFNFPAMIPLWTAAPALACGNALLHQHRDRHLAVAIGGEGRGRLRHPHHGVGHR